MKQEQERVRDWMAKFGQETHNCNPTIPSLEVRKLRAKLILEEALEAIEGLGIHITATESGRTVTIMANCKFSFEKYYTKQDGDLVEIADGLADSLVVILGTAVACGIDIKPVFDEVMLSNDSKLWTTTEVEQNKVQATQVSPYGFEDNDRNWLVKDDSGKVRKSPSYSPANIKQFVEQQ